MFVSPLHALRRSPSSPFSIALSKCCAPVVVTLIAVTQIFLSVAPTFADANKVLENSKGAGYGRASTPAELDDCMPVSATQAQAALKSAEAWARGLTTFQAHFSQESSAAALGAAEQSGGEVVFMNSSAPTPKRSSDEKKPAGSDSARMRWTYHYPEKQDFLINDDTMQLYQPGLKQLMIDSAKAVLSSDLPVAFLSGIATVSDKFSLHRGCAVLSPGKQDGAVRLELTPKEKGTLAQLHLVTEKPSGRVTGGTVIDESENITSFSFTRVVEGAPVASERFVMDVPPDTDVQDNRKK